MNSAPRLLVLLSTFYSLLLISSAHATTPAAPEPAISPTATFYEAAVALRPPPSSRPISPLIWGSNCETWSPLSAMIPFAPAARLAGIRVLRFMGGCSGEIYDWKRAQLVQVRDGTTVTQPAMSVDDALKLAKACGAELQYQLNVETRGLRNPCSFLPAYPGLSEEENTRILLADARDLLTSYSGRLRLIELGNEPWGSWSAADYTRVALTFARELKRLDPTLTILAVGHPSTGNNMAETISETRSDRDIGWTRAVQSLLRERCGPFPCVDLITDHPYVFCGYHPEAANDPGNFKGAAAWYPSVMYRRIFADRASDYDGRLAITEWNMKNWEIGSPAPIPLSNPGFESGLQEWSLESCPFGIAALAHLTSEAAEGSASLLLTLPRPPEATTVSAELSHPFPLAARPSGKFRAKAMISVSEPAKVSLRVDALNSTGSTTTLARTSLAALRAGQWQPIFFDGQSTSETASARLVIRAEKAPRHWERKPSPLTVKLDQVQVLSTDGWSPPLPATGTVEHGFFVLGSMLEMAGAGIVVANHHNYGAGPGGLFASPTELNVSGEGFALSSVLAGGSWIDAETTSPERFLPEGTCRTIRCLQGNITAPYLSAYAGISPDGEKLHLFLINRHETEGAKVQVRGEELALPATPTSADFHLLTATDYTERQFQKRNWREEALSLPGTIEVPPISALRVDLAIGK